MYLNSNGVAAYQRLLRTSLHFYSVDCSYDFHCAPEPDVAHEAAQVGVLIDESKRLTP